MQQPNLALNEFVREEMTRLLRPHKDYLNQRRIAMAVEAQTAEQQQDTDIKPLTFPPEMQEAVSMLEPSRVWNAMLHAMPSAIAFATRKLPTLDPKQFATQYDAGEAASHAIKTAIAFCLVFEANRSSLRPPLPL